MAINQIIKPRRLELGLTLKEVAAALGIAEVTDSITIVVSVEKGYIWITYSGIIITISDRDKLLEYIDLAME